MEIFFHEKINFISSNQRVISFLLHRYECFENIKKLHGKQRKNKGIMKICHSFPGCSFVWKNTHIYYFLKYNNTFDFMEHVSMFQTSFSANSKFTN